MALLRLLLILASLLTPCLAALAAEHPTTTPAVLEHNRRVSARSAVGFRKLKIADTWCYVIQVDLRNRYLRLRPYRAQDLGTRYRTFASFMRRTRPLAAITGTFFDIETGTIISNLVRDGHLLESGCIGRTLSIDVRNSARWLTTAGKAGGRFNWRQSEFAVSSGPSLVSKGAICLNPQAEGFKDPGLFRCASRAGIATNRAGKLLLVTTNQPISLAHFAKIMRKLGAQEAVNLDGGSSTALYNRGRYWSRPQRELTNVLAVTIRP